LWSEYERVIKDNGVILLFAQSPFDKVLGASNLKLLRYEWIWEKTQATGHLNAKKMPMKAHENILVFYKKLPTYNPQKTTGHERKVSKGYQRDICIARREEKWGDNYLYGKETTAPDYDSTERYPRSVLTFASDKQKSKLHPTQKPLSLIEYMIRTYTNEGDLILDNTCGSGTTGLGAKNLKRDYIMMEKDPEHYETACKRVLT
jgi:DNA modification methylase